MAEKTTKQQYENLTALIDAVKGDNLKQYGDIKEAFGAFTKIQERHEKEITKLKEDKIRRDAVEEYRQDNPKEVQDTMNKDQNTVTIPKDLLTAGKYIAYAIAALIAAVFGLKMI